MSHIFISYSREDAEFAQEIVEALAENKLDTWVDWKSIHQGDDWEREIYNGIETADAFLFLVSPDAVASQMCKLEIEHAVRNNKRILPIVIRDTDRKSIHPEISKRQWIFCRSGLDPFNERMLKVQDAVQTDYEWLKFHTQLQREALAWERQARETSRLLRGEELQATNSAFLANSGKDPSPTALQREYLAASQENEESLRKAGERRRTRTIVGLSLGLVIVTVMGIFAWDQRNIAVTSEQTTVAESNARATADGKAVEEANARATALVNEKYARETAQANAQAARHAEETAIAEREEAQRQALLAIAENLSADALDRIDTNYAEALLLGVESYRLLQINGLEQGRYPDTLPVLLQKIPTGLARTQSAPPFGGIRKIAYSPDGTFLVTLSDSIDLWDTQNPLSPRAVEGWDNSPDSPAGDAAFSPDSARLATGHQDGHIEVWELSRAGARRMASFPAFPPGSIPDIRVAISSDGGLLACSGNGTVLLLDLSQPDALQEIGHISHPHEGARVDYLWFDPNYKNPYLVTGGQDNTFRVWNLKEADFSPTQPYRSIPRGGGLADIATGARYLAVAGAQTIDLYHTLKNGLLPISTFPYSNVHRGPVASMSFSPSEARLFTAGQDGLVAEWDLANPYRIELVRTYAGHTNRVTSATFHPAGNIIASGGDDSRIVFWDIRDEATPSIWRGRLTSDAEISDIAYGPKTGLLAVGDRSGQVLFWDVSQPDAPDLRRKLATIHPVAALAFDPLESNLFFMGDRIGNYRPTAYSRALTRLDFSKSRLLLETNTTAIFAVGNEYLLAGEIADSKVDLYQWHIPQKEAVTRERRPLLRDVCAFNDTAFAQEGALAVIAGCRLQLWDFSAGQLPTLIAEQETPDPQAVALNAAGTLLASANAGGNSFSLWRISPEKQIELIATREDAHLNQLTSVALSPDETTLATGSADQSVILWNIRDPANPVQRAVLQGHSSAILKGGLFFAADGKTLFSASKEEVILWNVDPVSWLERACQIAGRNFSRVEWSQWLGAGIPYHQTCPQFPGVEEP